MLALHALLALPRGAIEGPARGWRGHCTRLAGGVRGVLGSRGVLCAPSLPASLPPRLADESDGKQNGWPRDGPSHAARGHLLAARHVGARSPLVAMVDRSMIGKPKAVHLSAVTDSGFLRPAPLALPEGELFTVLGVETSCDDTGVAIVRSDGVILGEALASQAALHEEWGGVVPTLARDAHEQVLDRMIDKALRAAGMESVDQVDVVAVTVGPGLEICLRVGCERVKALAITHAKPFVGVHHLEAHVLMARLGAPHAAAGVGFPLLTLLTSGGHCQLLLSRGVGEHQVIGSTLDDALGEAYDKVARLLDLPVGGGGGAALEALARRGDPAGVALPVPMRMKKSYDFSFAGLKTAARLAVERAPPERRAEPNFFADVAASFQHAAISHLEQRIKYAMELCEARHDEWGGAPSTLVVSGGVAANQELRRRLQVLCDETRAPGQEGGSWKLVLPPPRLCTDNGVMVAWTAVEMVRNGVAHVPDDQQVKARWPLGGAVPGTYVPARATSAFGKRKRVAGE